MQQGVPERAAGQHPDDRAGADDQQQEVGEHLVDAVLSTHELHAERLHAGQEVVAECPGHDQGDVGADPKHIPDRLAEAHPRARVELEQAGVGHDPAGLGDALRVRRLVPLLFRLRLGLGLRGGTRGRPVAGLGGEHALPAAGRLRQPEDQVREEEGRKGEDDEGGAPRQRGDVAGDGEADARPGQLPGEDVAEDLASLRPRDPVADQRRHRGRRGSGHRPEPDPVEEQLRERGCGRAPDHRDAPDHDRDAKDPGAPRPVGEHAERNREHGSHQRRHGDQQADVGVPDVQRMPQLDRCRADRGGVCAGQSEHAAEHEHDAGARRPAGRSDDLPPRCLPAAADNPVGGPKRPRPCARLFRAPQCSSFSPTDPRPAGGRGLPCASTPGSVQ